MPDAALEREAADFVVREARLLDERRWDEWLALFSDDGRYWVPLAGSAQAEGDAHNALADEDRLLLALRIERLKNPRAHSQRPPSRCQHVLQASRIQRAEAGTFELRTPFLYVESQGEREPLLLAGTARHTLVRDAAGALKMRCKRVDLLDAGRPLPAVQLFP